MKSLCLILITCVLVSGCVQTAAVYNLPRFSPTGEEVYAVKLEGDEVARYGIEPLPAIAPDFPGDKVVALDLEDGSERNSLSWTEIEWYRTRTEGQWKFDPALSGDAAEREKKARQQFDELLDEMPDKWAAQHARNATHFPTSKRNQWTYRVFDISPDFHTIVVEDHGSLVVFDVSDGWNDVLAQYVPPSGNRGGGSGDWFERNGPLLIVGIFVVGLIAAIIVGSTKSGGHGGHHGGYGHH